MPFLNKRVISQYVRRGCQRQLRLLLSPDNEEYRHEREEAEMPDPHPPRPGLEQVRQAGDEWEAEKIKELIDTLGSDSVVADSYLNKNGETRFSSIELRDYLSTAESGEFLIEAEFDVPNLFKEVNELDSLELDYGRLRPDLLQVLDPDESEEMLTPKGETKALPIDDDRFQLRVIDIKLTSEPSAAYFAEVTYYAMALAAWLIENDLDDQFVVSAEIAVWPGSHEGSELVARSREARDEGQEAELAELVKALEDDLEFGPVTVFSSRLRTFFLDELPDVLDQDWDELPWHVDHKCIGCRYLGQHVENPDERHCMPLAEETGHLSRVAYVSRGASDALKDSGVKNVSELAQRSTDDEAFDEHHTLKATRTVVSGRASALTADESKIPEKAGTSAVMPRWTHLRVYLTVDFDVGSAITLSFGLKAFWINPDDYEDYRAWDRETFVVETKDIDVERRALLRFLKKINSILEWAQERNEETTVQFYIWDNIQYKHFTRVIGRHLTSILQEGDVNNLAWLFPPEDVLENPEHASRNSPITIVSDVVRSVLAAPVPHVYSLLNVARAHHSDDLPEHLNDFSIHPHFEDDFSSVIPSERAHEIWGRVGGDYPWHEQLEDLKEAVTTRLMALEEVTERLEQDLRPELGSNAPKINISSPEREYGIGWDGQLWLSFAKLDVALDELEIESVRAMPPHEREARFHSAMLSDLLTGEARAEALTELGIDSEPELLVYQMESGSSEVKIREGDFDRCLAPNRDTSELHEKIHHVLSDAGVDDQVDLPKWLYYNKIEKATQVRVDAIDREQNLVAVKPDNQGLTKLWESGVYDFSKGVSLEPLHVDFYLDKLRRTLKSIGNPEIQRDDPLVRRAVGLEFSRQGRRTEHTPVAEVLWNADQMATEVVNRDVDGARSALERAGFTLNPSQWAAWEESLTSRLNLIWGPPGTGKSRTVRGLTLASLWDAETNQDNLRILICAPTYTALDNVLRGVYQYRENIVSDDAVNFHRIRSKWRDPPEGVLSKIDTKLNRHSPGDRIKQLKADLDTNSCISVVGATPQQVHNLIRLWDEDSGQRELFDLIVVDEASQMDVGHSILAYSSLAENGSVVVAGDPLQLAPIQNADPPLDLEEMVGSTYEFFSDLHDITESQLTTNYRSNDEIVEFQKSAGYPRELEPHSPDLEIAFEEEIPSNEPTNWPEGLPWGEFIEKLLSPEHSCICITYSGGRDSQWNDSEAKLVTSLVRALNGRLENQLKNERDGETGDVLPSSNECYNSEEFWQEGVGIVTPHKAQEALIINQLQQFTETGQEDLIRDAVDTVERFQGQQRDVIIASYAVSDPDLISDEDEFLLGLNRFNVLQSRARAKVIVILSEELIQHLSSDLEVLEESSLLKDYATLFCDEQYLEGVSYPGEKEDMPIAIKYHKDRDSSIDSD
jgi:hypothetical protein